MDTNIVAKCQWLEKKCTKYQQENHKLRQTVNRLQHLSSERSLPSQMYNHEVEHSNCLIKDLLKGNREAYQQFMKIPTPRSYTELYHEVLPDLRKYFLAFIRTIKNYLDFLQTVANSGPIFTTVSNECNVSLRDKLGQVGKKFTHYHSLLESSSWSASLD
ncbi:hypothetical protein LCGC14_2799930, partial [marine sediment metagenome]